MRWRAGIAAACAFASLDAFAHGGSVPPWVPVLIVIAFAGMIACVFVPPLVGQGSLWKRFLVGIAWAFVDFWVWIGLLWLVAGLEKQTKGLQLPEAVGYAVITLLTLSSWILPIVLFVKGRYPSRL